uniref:hypothetical protein n=1 Tax=Brucella pituitosa TaxID=571256 RepID=UPI001C27CD31
MSVAQDAILAVSLAAPKRWRWTCVTILDPGPEIGHIAEARFRGSKLRDIAWMRQAVRSRLLM